MGRNSPPPDRLAIEEEMLAEGASALRRIGERIDALLSELAALRARLPALAARERERAIARYAQAWGLAEHERWCLLVQREAMGFRCTPRDVEEAYPLPPRRP